MSCFVCAAGLEPADDGVQELWTGLQGTTEAAPGSVWQLACGNPGPLLPVHDELFLHRWPGCGDSRPLHHHGERWRLMGHGPLFVRPCWPALWAQLQAAAAADGGVPKRLALAGLLDTGKPAMLLYALRRLTHDAKAFSVVVQTSDDERIAFTRGQPAYLGDGAAFAPLLEMPGTWLLAHEDEGFAGRDTGAAHVLMTTARHHCRYQARLCQADCTTASSLSCLSPSCVP